MPTGTSASDLQLLGKSINCPSYKATQFRVVGCEVLGPGNLSRAMECNMHEQTKHEMERQRIIREILDENSRYRTELLESWNNRRQEELLARWDREFDNNTLWDL